jgi:hypothetical protein
MPVYAETSAEALSAHHDWWDRREANLPLVARYAHMWNIGNLEPQKIAEKIKVLSKPVKKLTHLCEIERLYLTPLYIKA